jgi:hypothetical protein
MMNLNYPSFCVCQNPVKTIAYWRLYYLLVEAVGITPHILVFRPFGASLRLFKFTSLAP